MIDVVRPKRVYRLRSKHPEGSLLDAAGVVMSLLRTSAISSLAELEAALAAPEPDEALVKKLAKYELTDAQLFAIERNRELLLMIRHSPAVSIAVCPACEGVSAVAGVAPTKCRTRLGCDGKPVKSTAATQFDPSATDSEGSAK